MSLSHTTTFNVNDFVKRMETVSDGLDPVNVKILRLVGKLGPRNLLDVARESGLPPSTVYNRVNILESKHGPLAFANPAVSKLGLARMVIFARAKPGMEQIAGEALLIPKYWRTLANAEGAFTHYCVEAIPYVHLSEFKKYVSRLVKARVLDSCTTFQTSDNLMNFPDFDNFNTKGRFWTFNWKLWLRRIERSSARRTIPEPENYSVQADKTDLIILKELERDGRRKFARIAKVVGVTLQAIKFRYDRRIVPRGLVQDYGFNFLTFPADVSDIREIKVDFRSLSALETFVATTQGLPFIMSYAKILRQNSLILRTYLPNSEFSNLFSFLSSLALRGLTTGYSSVRLHFQGMRVNSILPEMYSNEAGWEYDSLGHLKQLNRLLATGPKPIAR
jgi:DNA-binding Lrp family transcriptional regulator